MNRSGIDLHSNNGVVVVTDGQDRMVAEKRLVPVQGHGMPCPFHTPRPRRGGPCGRPGQAREPPLPVKGGAGGGFDGFRFIHGGKTPPQPSPCQGRESRAQAGFYPINIHAIALGEGRAGLAAVEPGTLALSGGTAAIPLGARASRHRSA
jgi:hypothetical protein